MTIMNLESTVCGSWNKHGILISSFFLISINQRFVFGKQLFVCIRHLRMKVNAKAEEIERRRQAEEELLGPQRFRSLLVVF